MDRMEIFMNKIKLGEKQVLKVVKTTGFGVYLSLPESGDEEVLLPRKQVPESVKEGDLIEVFIYKDSEDRVIATTTEPGITLGKVAKLPVKQVTRIGAFLDWNLAKDLLLPFKEQIYKVQEGEEVLVALYIDKSERLCATMHIYDYLSTNNPYSVDDMVDGTLYEIIENFGAFVAVDDAYSGMIPMKEFTKDIKPGSPVHTRVTGIKEDGKLTLSLYQKAHVQMDTDSKMIYEKLKEAGGFLPYHDKSSADDIKAVFHLSKNAFKRAIGRLYKEKRIQITDKGIQITKNR